MMRSTRDQMQPRGARPLVPVALLVLVALAAFRPVDLGRPAGPRAAFAVETPSLVADPNSPEALAGTWRTMDAEGYPDFTLNADGSVAFAEGETATTDSGCTGEEIKSWRVSDPGHIELLGDSTTNTLAMTHVDANTLLMTDELSGRQMLLVRPEVFGNPPVILVHGLNGSADTWVSWVDNRQGVRPVVAEGDGYRLEFARSTYFGEDVPVFLLDYSDDTHRPVVENAAAVSWALDNVKATCDPGGGQVKAYLVGHSLGGLISRTYLASLPSTLAPELGVAPYSERNDVLGLATLGTPHGGSFLTVLKSEGGQVELPDKWHTFGLDLVGGAAGDDMHPDSVFIGALNKATLPVDVRYAAVVGLYDQTSRGWRIGDAVVHWDAQIPYAAGRGGGIEAYTAFTDTHDFELEFFDHVVHLALIDPDGEKRTWTTETDDEGIARWVVKQYRIAVDGQVD